MSTTTAQESCLRIEDVTNGVTRLILDVRDNPNPIWSVLRTTDLRQDLGFDGMDLVGLQCAIEDKFGITLDDDIWRAVTDVESVHDVVFSELRAAKVQLT